jgi:alpha-mannosidase
LETAQQLKFSDISIVSRGPLRAAIMAELKYHNSKIQVLISLDAVGATTKENSKSFFRFDALIDWHERHELLKFELPLDIHNYNATYECQFGHVQRPTHKNTSFDVAKFEVCGHKYADLSEFGYGVALLSESKYGFSCRGNVLCMSLLRAATAPDAEQDQGEHRFSWAVMPHEGHFLESDVPVAAYLFNSPLRMRCTRVKSVSDVPTQVASQKPVFTSEGARNVFLETVKRGEDDNFSWHPTALDPETGSDKSSDSGATFATTNTTGTGSADLEPNMTVILRLYEAYGGHAHARLKIAGHLATYVSAAYVTNMLEDNEAVLKLLRAGDEGAVMSGIGGEDASSALIDLNFRGFEVKTIKLVVQRSKIDHGILGMSGKKKKRDSWVDLEQEQGGIFVRKTE